MSTLVVLAFPTEGGAQQVLGVVSDLKRQQLITLEDAAIVVRRQDGKPKVTQTQSLVGAGAWGGAFWGLLIGLLFFMPWLGMAAGALGGALGGRFMDIGIDDAFIKAVGQQIQPGTSALFLLVRQATMDRVLDALRPYNPEVLQTSLSAEQEAKLRDAFGGAPEAEPTPSTPSSAPAEAPASPAAGPTGA